MADKMVSGEDRKQVSIGMWSSTASDRSFTAGGGATVSAVLHPNSPAALALSKVMGKSKLDGDQDEQEELTSEIPLIKKVAAEFIGTFILIFTVLSTVIMNTRPHGTEGLLGIAASAGLAVVAVVLAVVHISGSHLNPAVSIAMAVFGHLPPAHVLPYAAAQTLASTAAAFLARGMYHPHRPAIMATVPTVGIKEAFIIELVLAFILMFIVTAVATDPSSSKELIAIAIAAVIMMNALVAGPTTGPSMNPARTIGAALATGVYKDIWVYLVATPLGAIAGTGAYTLIKP